MRKKKSKVATSPCNGTGCDLSNISEIIDSYKLHLDTYEKSFLLVSKRLYAAIEANRPDVLHRVMVMPD